MTRLQRFLPALALLTPSLSFAINCDYSAAPDADYGRNYAEYARWCEECGGTPYKEGGIGCNPGSDWGHPARTNSAPATRIYDSSADDAARAAEAQRQKAAAEEKRRRFISDRDNALHSLKGTTPASGGELKLKGDTNAFSSQLKGSSPKIEGTTLKTAPTARVAAPSGVWKQILCAHGLAQTALAAAKRGDPEEASLLLDQSSLAATGGELSVECPDTVLPKGFNSPPPNAAALSAFYLKLKDKAVADATAIAAADAARPKLQKRVKDAEAAAAKATKEKPAAPTATPPKPNDVDRVREEQRRINAERSKEFDDLKKEQADINKANDEELAFLREAQKLLNEQNSKKIRAEESVKAMNGVSADALRDPKAAMAALDKIP